MSPPANTLGLPVWKACVWPLATTRPPSSMPMPWSPNQSAGLGRKPKAMITRSQGSTSSVPGTGSGRRRPRLSGAPSWVVTSFTPSTLPSPTISMGWRLYKNSTPSSLALATSRREPGMFSSSRR